MKFDSAITFNEEVWKDEDRLFRGFVPRKWISENMINIRFHCEMNDIHKILDEPG